MPSPLTEYEPEWETFEAEAPQWSNAGRYEVLGDAAELELAAELLGVADEQELDHFLGKLLGKVGRAVGSLARSPVTGAIGRALKGIIGKSLPLAGGAVGTLVGGPLGASVGSSLASMAGRAFGLELEGLSPEDQELEAAKRFVRFASDAAQYAMSAPPSSDPRATAQAAISAAARRTAPGLLRFAMPMPTGPGGPARALRRRWRRHRRRRAPHPGNRPAEDTMHDIDRVQLEADYEGDFEGEYEGDFEMENDEYGELEWMGEAEAVFNEAEEMEMASHLMEIADEQELDQFLGSLIRRAGRALGGFVQSPDGQAIGGILKGAVRQLLPRAASAVGSAIGGPLGAQISSGLSSLAGNELELEAEGWDQEDREYEGAKQFVRLAADTVRNALAAGPYAEPAAAAQAAIAQAASTLAPGLLQSPPAGPGAGMSGRWVRRGSTIVLYGV